MVFTMPAKEFKNLTLSPEDEAKGFKRCYCYVPVSTIPDHLKDYVIGEIEEQPTIEKIAEWLETKPKEFHLLAPKVVLHTAKFVFDNRKNKLSFELEEEHQGVICGSNTLVAVLTNRTEYSANTPDGEVYIELELLKGLDKDEVSMVAEQRKY